LTARRKSGKNFPANFLVTGKVAGDACSSKRMLARDRQSRPTQLTNQQMKIPEGRNKIWKKERKSENPAPDGRSSGGGRTPDDSRRPKIQRTSCEPPMAVRGVLGSTNPREDKGERSRSPIAPLPDICLVA